VTPPAPAAPALDFGTPAERAAAELGGWLDAGERVVALLAPRGAARRRIFDALAASLDGRFVASRWTGSPRPATLPAVPAGGRAPRSLLLVEEGERLGAEGARALRALADDAAGERCVAIALEPREAGAVLGGLGPDLEIVVLGPERGAEPGVRAARLRAATAVTAILLAGLSLGLSVGLLLPRFRSPPPAAAPAVAALPAAPAPSATAEDLAALPSVGAPPPAAPDRAETPKPRAAAREARRTAPAAPAAEPPSRAAEPREARQTAPGAGEVPADPEAGGWLVVNAIPRAWIAVDGAPVGETPIVRHPVSGGPHRVSARFEDGRSAERHVQVVDRELYLMFDGRTAETTSGAR
jgi:hypothetical protein